MAKRTVEIEDVLDDCVAQAIEECKQCLEDGGSEDDFHEIIDSAVPIWTAQIEGAWFLHRNALEEAYDNAGIGGNPRENSGMAAIYCYIEEKVRDWHHNYRKGER